MEYCEYTKRLDKSGEYFRAGCSGEYATRLKGYCPNCGRKIQIKIDPTNRGYWNNICKMQEKQTIKGIETYGMPLEDNTSSIVTRLEMLEEELIDALMYIEHIKEGIR